MAVCRRQWGTIGYNGNLESQASVMTRLFAASIPIIISAQTLESIVISVTFTPVNRPLPRPGERHFKSMCNFSAGSVRRYISVVLRLWCHSYTETDRRRRMDDGLGRLAKAVRDGALPNGVIENEGLRIERLRSEVSDEAGALRLCADWVH